LFFTAPPLPRASLFPVFDDADIICIPLPSLFDFIHQLILTLIRIPPTRLHSTGFKKKGEHSPFAHEPRNSTAKRADANARPTNEIYFTILIDDCETIFLPFTPTAFTRKKYIPVGIVPTPRLAVTLPDAAATGTLATTRPLVFTN
jgi:hypothetical protein